jgi:DNA-binding FadR family transcriptional regulator
MKRSEIIARDLVGYIIDERLPPGARLPRERDMVEQLGVGRTTLREALRILETWGIVSVRSGPGGGPVVRHPAPDDLTEALTLILQFQRATLIEVLDARMWLEPTAARLATEHVLATELQRLRALNDTMAQTDTDPTFAELNRRFHTLIAGATGNLIVQVFTATLLTVAESGITDLHHSEESRKIAVAGHDSIIKAFEAGDPVMAEKAMRDHMMEGRRQRLAENKTVMSRPLRWVS